MNDREVLSAAELNVGAQRADEGSKRMAEMETIASIAASATVEQVATGRLPGRLSSDATDGYTICQIHYPGGGAPIVDGRTGERVLKGTNGVCVECYKTEYSPETLMRRRQEAAVVAREAADQAEIAARLARERAEELEAQA